jgi:Polyketide cyclase / dehydrase and lipid transport
VKAGTYGEARTEVHASPVALYEIVSDVCRMGEWSPECRRCEWIEGATGPAVGARFKGTNQHGVARWSNTPRVVVADSGREFAFVTGHLGRDMTRWSYRFETAAHHTTVTESFEMLRDMPWYFRLADRLLMGVKDRKADLETNMGETLRHIKAAAEGAMSVDR